jgi:hypothetical protein
MSVLANLEQKIQLLGEERVIVAQVETKMRKGLYGRTSSCNDLSMPMGDQVQGGEFLKDSDGVGGAENGDRTCQPNVFGAGSGRTEDHRRSRIHGTLAKVTPSPVVELNRAVAVAMAFGPAAGLELVDALVTERSLQHYHLLPSVRGDLLQKLNRNTEAQAEFERAASMTRNSREVELLLARARACAAKVLASN